MNRSPFGARTLLATIAISLCFMSFPLSASASTNSDSAREQAKKILSNEKYGSEDKQPLNKDVERLSDWLGGKKAGSNTRDDEQINEQYSQPSPATTPAIASGLGGVGKIFLFILFAVMIGGLGYVIYLALRNRNKKKQHDEEVENIESLDIDWTDEEKVIEHITDADLLEKMSNQAEEAGHLDLALRYRFRAGLLRLNDVHAINFHPSITNAQWQLVINNDAFDTLTKDFNDVTYGHKPCDISYLARARSEWARVMSERKASRESAAS